MTFQEIQAALEKNLPGVKFKVVRESLLVENAADLPKAAQFLKSKLGFTF